MPDFSRGNIAVLVEDMQLMDNTFFYARDDTSADVYFSVGGTQLHYQIVHVSKKPFDKAWIRVETSPFAEIGRIEIANYDRHKIVTATNYEPIKIAEGNLYVYFIHMTVTRVASSDNRFQDTPGEVSLWSYSVALYMKQKTGEENAR